jgi:hypothetical protein
MIPPLVFSEWTSMSSSEELEREFKEESIKDPDSVNSKELPRKKPSNGSLRSALELSSDYSDVFQYEKSTLFFYS